MYPALDMLTASVNWCSKKMCKDLIMGIGKMAICY